MGSNDEKGNNFYGDTYYTNQSYKYESDDRQILVDLLCEYSEKLTIACNNIDLKRSEIRIIDLFLIIPTIFTMIAALITLQSKVIDYGLPLFSFIICLISTITAIYISNLDRSQRMPSPKIKSLTEREARNIALKLEKVVRLTTEIQDQLELNLARKIELDLRIADAESALDYYYSTIERKDRKK